MKKHDEKIDTAVRQTMAMLDEFPHHELPRHFRSRLAQRIESENAAAPPRGLSYHGILREPRMALMLLLLLVNMVAAIMGMNSSTELVAGNGTEIRDTQSFTYSGHDFAYYDMALSDTAVETP